ncbi:hypothetical protein [Enterococcus termitis]|uniref:Uncharacterized protein n=1 Tax=Enterococcus termitis TaxID=332950 RepID=A0A1E5GI81_9ENTE|nr:hypothetical protein [Enterococcus termitis]OEG12311.1 hypothetical protein BCR25_07150 [Enterococcus termitis]OJG98868.1 hypothetical protein RV18_GL002730 [Enterococcus termitis]
MKEDTAQNYKNKNEAEKAVLNFLEKKYDKKFTLVGEGKLESSKNIKYFQTKFKDEEGLEAEIVLPQEKKSSLGDVLGSGVAGTSDTYSQTFYTKKTREAVEPLFKDEPFEKFFIDLEGAGHAKNDLSLSVDEYFKKYQTEYTFFIILKDNQNAEYYADIIYPFYQKLITEQSQNFGLFIYADKKEIFSVAYVNSKGFNAEITYEEVLKDVQDGLDYNQPQPEEKWLRSKYYNGENE